MKAGKLVLVWSMFLLLIASFAVADVTFSDDTLTLDVDYGNFDNDDFEDFIQESFTVKIQNSDGAVSETVDIVVEGLPSTYDIDAASKSVTVAANGTESVTFTLNVTHDKDAGEEKVGTVKIMSGSTELAQKDLTQNTLSMLELDKIRVDYENEDGNSKDDDFNGNTDDDSFTLDDNVRPGSEFVLEFDFDNLFDSDYKEGDIEDIEIEFDINDDDVFDDYDDKYDVGTIDAGEDDTFEVKWDVALDADADDYTLEITITGEDEQGSKYEIKKELDFSVERERDDVRIITHSFSQSSVDNCQAGSVTYTLKVQNVGEDDQQDVSISVYNKDLKLDENFANIELEEYDDDDDEWQKSFTVAIPKGLKAKIYEIESRVFIDNDDLMDLELSKLTVTQCSDTVEEEKEDDSETTSSGTTSQTTTGGTAGTTTQSPNDSTTQPTTGTEVVQGSIVTSVEDPYTSDDFFVAILIIGIVLITAIIILFIVLLLKK